MMTLNFIQSISGPFSIYSYCKFFPGTDLEQFALNHGMPKSY